jgi:drug/metabolite transporter (DMT)-like permease
LKPISRRVALALMVSAPLLWSTAGVVTRHIERATPFEMVFWRSLFAGALVGAYLLFTKKGDAWRMLQATGWPGMLSGTLWAVMFTAFLVALTLTTTANTLIVMSVAPLLTAVFATLFLKERIAPRTWLAIAAATGGLAWMFGGGFAAHGARDIAGMLVALLVPIASASNVVNLRAVAGRINLVPAILIGAVLACAVSLPFALPLSATPRDFALLVFLGVFQLGLPCILMVTASRALMAPEMALIGLLEVLLGPLWAWLGAGETPARATLIGGAIVLSALVANEMAAFRRIIDPKLSVTRISG